MGLEAATYVSQLDATNPVAGDSVSQGDDHLRLIKSTIKNTFPNINAAVGASDEDLAAPLESGASLVAGANLTLTTGYCRRGTDGIVHLMAALTATGTIGQGDTILTIPATHAALALTTWHAVGRHLDSTLGGYTPIILNVAATSVIYETPMAGGIAFNSGDSIIISVSYPTR